MAGADLSGCAHSLIRCECNARQRDFPHDFPLASPPLLGAPAHPGSAQVKAKKEWNNAQAKLPDAKVLKGEVWYRQQGFRAYNQAVGRCIRHQVRGAPGVQYDGRSSILLHMPLESMWLAVGLHRAI